MSDSIKVLIVIGICIVIVMIWDHSYVKCMEAGGQWVPLGRWPTCWKDGGLI